MMVFIARAGLGGGANLVCTVLMLSLFTHVGLGRILGAELHLQLDNTTAENKNEVCPHQSAGPVHPCTLSLAHTPTASYTW